MARFLALVILTLPTTYAQAEELTRFILIQPLSHVREKCAIEAVPDWGCVTLQRATDNPNDVICLLRIPAGLPPWDQNALLERLRPQCVSGLPD